MVVNCNDKSINNLSICEIRRGNGLGGNHRVEYAIYTSMSEVSKNHDPALKKFLNTINWDTGDFEIPIVRIYNILDENNRPIDAFHIKIDMEQFVFKITEKFIEIDKNEGHHKYYSHPIYFASIQDISTTLGNNRAIERYRSNLAYKCMQFELAGFFNIRAMVRDSMYVSFLHANEAVEKLYTELIYSKALI